MAGYPISNGCSKGAPSGNFGSTQGIAGLTIADRPVSVIVLPTIEFPKPAIRIVCADAET